MIRRLLGLLSSLYVVGLLYAAGRVIEWNGPSWTKEGIPIADYFAIHREALQYPAKALEDGERIENDK